MDNTTDRRVLVESIGSALWFAMDGLWMFESTGLAELLIAPAVIVNALAFRGAPRSISEFGAITSVNVWLWMNVLWMLGDLEAVPRLISIAKVLFGTGLAALLLTLLSSGFRETTLVKAFAHFRRVRW